MDSIEDRLQPFIGYFDLGMYLEAGEELENLPLELKGHPLALLSQLELHLQTGQWAKGALLGETACRLWPDEEEFFVKRAYCLHELNRTSEAKTVLLASPSEFHGEALYFYNLACYETQLGNLEEGRRLLKLCFRKDHGYRKGSARDPDLEPLWKSISKL